MFNSIMDNNDHCDTAFFSKSFCKGKFQIDIENWSKVVKADTRSRFFFLPEFLD